MSLSGMRSSWAQSAKQPPNHNGTKADNVDIRLRLRNLPSIDVLSTNISKIILSQTIKSLNLRWHVIYCDYEEVFIGCPYARHHDERNGM